MHQSFVSPRGIGSPGSHPTPQLQIEVQTQLFGVVVSGSATSFELRVSTDSFNSCSAFCRENGHDAMKEYMNKDTKVTNCRFVVFLYYD